MGNCKLEKLKSLEFWKNGKLKNGTFWYRMVPKGTLWYHKCTSAGVGRDCGGKRRHSRIFDFWKKRYKQLCKKVKQVVKKVIKTVKKTNSSSKNQKTSKSS